MSRGTIVTKPGKSDSRRQRETLVETEQASPGGAGRAAVTAGHAGLQPLADGSAQVRQADTVQRMADGVGMPIQAKSNGAVMQRVWTEWDGVSKTSTFTVHSEDKPPPGQYNRKTHPGDPKKIVWVKKGTIAPPPSYDDKLGVLPKREDSSTTFTVASDLVRFSQDSISSQFSDGGSVSALIANLKDKTTKSSSLPAIRVTMRNKRLVTLDNRRLHACQQAGVPVKCRWATEEEVEHDKEKFTAGKNGSATITVR